MLLLLIYVLVVKYDKLFSFKQVNYCVSLTSDKFSVVCKGKMVSHHDVFIVGNEISVHL